MFIYDVAPSVFNVLISTWYVIITPVAIQYKKERGHEMSLNFIPYDRETDYLLPPSLNDWVPDNHLARFVSEIISQLDL